MAVGDVTEGDVPAEEVLGGEVLPADKESARRASLAVSELSEDQQFTTFKSWFKADADHSRDWRTAASNAFAFRAGEQWTEEDKNLLDSRQRPHIVFNRVLAILKAVAGMEINGRHEIAFIPRGTEDTKVNELLTAASKWMADLCDGEDEESQAFEDAATCGMGWTENRMSYEDDTQGLYVEEELDPLEMYWDRTARKKNLTDARRVHRARRMAFADAIQLFPGKSREELDARWASDYLGDFPTRSIEDRRKRDEEHSVGDEYDDRNEVTIVNTQWIEKEPFWLVADIQSNEKRALSEEEFHLFKARMDALRSTAAPEIAPMFEVHAVRMVRKIYKSAFLGGVLLRKAEDAPIKGAFSWACITGEFNKKTGTWFGLVQTMRDPQMWANKWLSQTLHIMNSTAKGGILAEEDAFEDQREAEESYAQSDEITYVAPGALSGNKPKIMPKPGQGIPDGFIKLMEFAISSIKDVVGINLELLGQRDENQPGIVESMRKQAGMTVLATLFDSLRRFRKIVGRKRLFFIQNYLSDGRLIRVIGTQGDIKAIPLLRDKCLGEYDVVVDDTPTSPNQKEANWAIIQPLLVVFKEQLMANPMVLVTLLEYSPLPSRIIDTIKQFIEQQGQDPEAEIDKNLTRNLIASEASKNQATAEMNLAKAGSTQATAMYDIAMAKNLLAQNDVDGLRAHLEAMESAGKARTAAAQGDKAAAEADHTRAKTAREMVGTQLDVEGATDKRLEAAHKRRAERMGQLIESLAVVGKRERDAAGALKDTEHARLLRRTPAKVPAK